MKIFNYKGVEISVGIKERQTECVNGNVEQEKEILNKWIPFIEKRYSITNLTIEENATDYTTLKYDDWDLIRLHYGEKTKWVKLIIASKYKKQYIDDSRFASEKNKNKVVWKLDIENDDINYFLDILDNIVDHIKKVE